MKGANRSWHGGIVLSCLSLADKLQAPMVITTRLSEGSTNES